MAYYNIDYNFFDNILWDKVADYAKTTPAVSIAFVLGILSESYSSIKRGTLNYHCIAKIASRLKITLKSAKKMTECLKEIDFLSQDGNTLFIINYEKYQTNFKNYQTDTTQETKENRNKRLTRERQQRFKDKQKGNVTNNASITQNNVNNDVVTFDNVSVTEEVTHGNVTLRGDYRGEKQETRSISNEIQKQESKNKIFTDFTKNTESDFSKVEVIPFSPEVEKPKPAKLKSDVTPFDEDFEKLWRIYPPRANSSKKNAKSRFVAILNKSSDSMALTIEIMAGAKIYAQSRQGQTEQFTKHLETWLNGELWKTAGFEQENHPPPTTSPQKPYLNQSNLSIFDQNYETTNRIYRPPTESVTKTIHLSGTDDDVNAAAKRAEERRREFTDQLKREQNSKKTNGT